MNPDPAGHIRADATFVLRPGVRLEPFPDGTAILHASDRGETLSLNPAAAYLCACADSEHTLTEVYRQAVSLAPNDELTLEGFLDCARELSERGFLVVVRP
jgi:hypothetical protein